MFKKNIILMVLFFSMIISINASKAFEIKLSVDPMSPLVGNVSQVSPPHPEKISQVWAADSFAYDGTTKHSDIFPNAGQGGPFYPTVAFIAGFKWDVELTDADTGGTINAKIAVKQVRFETASMNWAGGGKLGNCDQYAPGYFTDGDRRGWRILVTRLNDMPNVPGVNCRLPKYSSDYASYNVMNKGKEFNDGNMAEVSDIVFELSLESGKYYAGNYRAVFPFTYGAMLDTSNMLGLASPQNAGGKYINFSVPSGTIPLDLVVEILPYTSLEFLSSQIKLVDTKNVWLHSGVAPDYLEGTAKYRFESNKRKFSMNVTCDHMSIEGDCKMVQDGDNTKYALLDVNFDLPSNYQLTGGTEFSLGKTLEFDVDDTKPAVAFGNVKISTKPGEAKRIYNESPGESYSTVLKVDYNAL
ncbi:hypothetical protein ACE1OE_00640 [Vibrio sp. E150_011]